MTHKVSFFVSNKDYHLVRLRQSGIPLFKVVGWIYHEWLAILGPGCLLLCDVRQPSIHTESFCFPKIWSSFRLLHRLCVVRVYYILVVSVYCIWGSILFLRETHTGLRMALNKDESSMFSLGTHRIILSANSYLIDDIAEEQRNKIL